MEQTIGQQLKQIRESRGLTLDEIAEKTRIRLVYLRAIEENDLDVLPSPMQMRGFLRLYASELDVEIDSLKVEGYHLFNEVEDETPSPDSETTPPVEPEITESQESQVEVEPQPETHTEVDLPIEEEFPGREPEETLASTACFIRIGKKLQERRNLLSLSLDDIKSNLHIRKHYIESLESGQIENLPSPVQTKGLLANYAEFLNLDVDSLLLEYAEGLQERRLEKTQTENKRDKAPRELSSTSLKLRNFFSLDLLVMAVIFIGFGAFVIWGVSRIISANSPEAAATSLPEVAEVLLATSSPTSQDTPSIEITTPPADNEGAVVVTETPLFTSAVSADAVNVIIVPLQRVWVQISVDTEVTFEGRLIPGNAYDYSGAEKVEILTGNAGAIQILFNDQDLGSMGLIGQVSNLIFTRDGLLLPTATITPTPTETPQTSPTPTSTPTLSPTTP